MGGGVCEMVWGMLNVVMCVIIWVVCLIDRD